jgi:hypothetical protein
MNLTDVLIEKQPRMNSKMVKLSFVLYVYFKVAFPNISVNFIDSKHKLKVNLEKFCPTDPKLLKKITYKQRKMKSVEICGNLLDKIIIVDKLVQKFNRSKKKDDYSDSLLQCVYHIQNNYNEFSLQANRRSKKNKKKKVK